MSDNIERVGSERRRGNSNSTSCAVYELLPTSSVLTNLAGAAGVSLTLLTGSRGCLLSSSVEGSAVLRRFSTGEDTDDVFRLLLPAGAYLSIERCLFLSLRRSGLRLLLGLARGRLLPRSLLRLRLRLRRRSSRCLRPL